MQEEPGRRSLRGGGPGLVLPPPGPCSCSRPPPSLGLFLQTPALACLGFALPDPACSCVLLLVTSVTSPSLSTPSVPSRQPARLLTQPTLPWRELPPHPSSSLCSARVTSPWVGSLLPLLYTQPSSLLASRPQAPIRIYWNLPPVLILQHPRAWAWLPPPWSA